MERASQTFVEAFVALIHQQEFVSPSISIYCGQGNNGGDGLAIARLLFAKGFKVCIIILATKPKGSESFEINLGRVNQLNISISYLKAANDLESLAPSDIIIDAIIGLGINKPLQGLPFEVVQYLNQLAAFKVAVDLPTPNLKVHFTFTFPKPI
jgi:NAD(P)H-hydrate epimerase